MPLSKRFRHESSARSLREAADNPKLCEHKAEEFRARAREESHLAATSPDPTPAEQAADREAVDDARKAAADFDRYYIGF